MCEGGGGVQNNDDNNSLVPCLDFVFGSLYRMKDFHTSLMILL